MFQLDSWSLIKCTHAHRLTTKNYYFIVFIIILWSFLLKNSSLSYHWWNQSGQGFVKFSGNIPLFVVPGMNPISHPSSCMQDGEEEGKWMVLETLSERNVHACRIAMGWHVTWATYEYHMPHELLNCDCSEKASPHFQILYNNNYNRTPNQRDNCRLLSRGNVQNFNLKISIKTRTSSSGLS